MSNTENSSVDRVAMRIPPFWPEDPELWFVQVETQFALANVTTDETKYNYVAANLEARFAAEVRDILVQPPSASKYDTLKKELIGRLSVSQDQKTRQLLGNEEMGDRKPSQFLRHLRSLAGAVVKDDVLKHLWLTRLPPSTQAILATQQSEDLNTLAKLADAVLEANPRSLVAETTATASSMESLMERLSILMATKMEEVANTLRGEMAAVHAGRQRDRSPRHQPRPRPSSRSTSRSSSPSRFHEDVCWYHRRFGDQASRCTQPCTYKRRPQGNDKGSH